MLEYHKRGWTSNNSFLVNGEVFSGKNQVVYKFDGNWSQKITLINAKNTSEKEVLWTKSPYPEKWEYMYGMSHFML